jgi:hypothetical protein
MQRPSSPEKPRLHPMPRLPFRAFVWIFALPASWWSPPRQCFDKWSRGNFRASAMNRQGAALVPLGQWSRTLGRAALAAREGRAAVIETAACSSAVQNVFSAVQNVAPGPWPPHRRRNSAAAFGGKATAPAQRPGRSAKELFDHLVSGGEQRLRDGQTERPASLHVDDQFILDGSLHR